MAVPIVIQGLNTPQLFLQGYFVGLAALPTYASSRILYDNIPPQWLAANPNFSGLIAQGEAQLTYIQQTLVAVAASRYLATALGSDLDNCLALVGILRYANETDDDLRARAIAILASTQSASSTSLMAATLSAAMSGTVQVLTNPSPAGTFTVIVQTPLQNLTPASMKALIETLRSAGTSYSVYINAARRTAALPKVGTFKVGTRKAGAYNALRIL